KVMDLVRKHELFELYSTFAKLARELDRLIERNVAIVVSVNQQHRRFPFVHRRDRRRLAAELGQLAGRPRRIAYTPAPIVNSVNIDACREEIRIMRKSHRSQVTAIRPAPQSDVLAIDVAARAQVLARGDDVLILGRAARTAMPRLTERPPVTDAAPIVD